MLYPVIPVEEWIKRYPALGTEPVCDCDPPDLRPYRTRRVAGIECQICNTGMWMLVKAEDNQFMLDMLG